MHRERGEEVEREREREVRGIERFTAHSPTLFLSLAVIRTIVLVRSLSLSSLCLSLFPVTFSPLIPFLFLFPSFFLLVSQVLWTFAFLRRLCPPIALSSFVVSRPLSLSLTFPNAMLSLLLCLVRLPSNCIHLRSLASSLSLSFFLSSSSLASRSRSLHPLYSGSTLSPTRRTQYYIPLGPASPTLPPLPHLDMV